MSQISSIKHVAFVLLIGGICLVALFVLENDYQSDHSHIRAYQAKNDFSSVQRLAHSNQFLFPKALEFAVDQRPIIQPGNNIFIYPELDVLLSENQLAGFVAYYMAGSDSGKIVALAVNESMRHRGYGQRLVQSAIKNLRKAGARRIFVDVPAYNEYAGQFFQHLGFKVSKDRNSESAIFNMKLNLY